MRKRNSYSGSRRRRRRRTKQSKTRKRRVSSALKSARSVNDVIKHLSKISNLKHRNKVIRQCNDRFIHELSPKIRKGFKYISPLLSSKGKLSLNKFISRRTPIHVRRQMIRGQTGGGSWFTNLIGSIVPLLGSILL